MDFLNTLLSAQAAIFTTITAAIAVYISIRTDEKQKHTAIDESIIDRSEIFLSRAYTVLASGEDGNSLPIVPSRYDWLTAARMLEEHKRLILGIKLDQNKEKIDAIQEYWRSRLVNLFIPLHSNPNYFLAGPNGHTNRGVGLIYPLSAKIIFDFIRWPDGRDDVLNSVDIDKLVVPLTYRPAMRVIEQNASRRSHTEIIVAGSPPADSPNSN